MPPLASMIRPFASVWLPFAFVLGPLACDRGPERSQQSTSYAGAAAVTVAPTATSVAEAGASAARAGASPTPFVGPVGVRPLIDGAKARYPAAKHVTVEGDVFVLLTLDDSPILTAAAREVPRVLPSFLDGRFARLPVMPVYIVVFSTFTAFDEWSKGHYGVDGTRNLGSYQRATREMAVDLSAGDKAIPTIFLELVHGFTEARSHLAPS